jgi:hypothetical protein
MLLPRHNYKHGAVMPYIKKEFRSNIGLKTDHLDPMSSGELNYLFTKIAHNYIENQGENYQAYNDIIGALEGAKLELYRRMVAPYEDTKIKENGDV